MARLETRRVPKALLAFGRRVSADDAFEELVATRGWQMERWKPTFVESCDRDRFLNPPRDEPAVGPGCSWESRQVLRRPLGEFAPEGKALDAEARLMVASAAELPSLYFVEWHYIDFVLSCLGNVSEAARVLGIRRSTLQRKRKKTPPSR
jgi:Bacterial regulatory protein, Fis family